MVAIILEDRVNNQKYEIILSQTDIDKVDNNWYQKDSLLINLQHTDFFKNRTTWSELKPLHYNLLIANNLSHLDNLKIIQRSDLSHPVVQSLYFLIGGFIKCVFMNADTNIEFLKINRLTKDIVNFDYYATLFLTIKIQNDERELKIVVDNTVND